MNKPNTDRKFIFFSENNAIQASTENLEGTIITHAEKLQQHMQKNREYINRSKSLLNIFTRNKGEQQITKENKILENLNESIKALNEKNYFTEFYDGAKALNEKINDSILQIKTQKKYYLAINNKTERQKSTTIKTLNNHIKELEEMATTIERNIKIIDQQNALEKQNLQMKNELKKELKFASYQKNAFVIQNKNLEKENQNLQNKLNFASNEKIEIVGQNKKLEEQYQQMQSEIEKMETEINNKTIIINQQNDLEEKNQQKQNELENKLNEYKQQFDQLLKEKDHLKKERLSVNQEKELTDNNEELNRISKENNILHENIKNLQAKIDDLEKLHQKGQDDLNKLDQKRKDDLDNLLQRGKDNLKTKHNEFNNKLNTLEQQLKSEKHEKQEQLKTIDRLNTLIESKNNAYNELYNQNEKLSKENFDLKNKSHSLSAYHKTLEDNISNIRKNEFQRSINIDQLTKQNEELQKINQKFKGNLKENKKEIQTLNKELESKRTEYLEQIKNLELKIKKLDRLLKNSQETIGRLNQSYKKSVQKLEKNTEQFSDLQEIPLTKYESFRSDASDISNNSYKSTSNKKDEFITNILREKDMVN